MGCVMCWVDWSQVLCLSLTLLSACGSGEHHPFEAPALEISLHWPVGLLICKQCQIRNFKHYRATGWSASAEPYQQSFVSAGQWLWKKARLHCSFCSLSKTQAPLLKELRWMAAEECLAREIEEKDTRCWRTEIRSPNKDTVNTFQSPRNKQKPPGRRDHTPVGIPWPGPWEGLGASEFFLLVLFSHLPIIDWAPTISQLGFVCRLLRQTGRQADRQLGYGCDIRNIFNYWERKLTRKENLAFQEELAWGR